jgi:hypothetical protein
VWKFNGGKLTLVDHHYHILMQFNILFNLQVEFAKGKQDRRDDRRGGYGDRDRRGGGGYGSRSLLLKKLFIFTLTNW